MKRFSASMRRFSVARIAKLSLAGYAVALTVAVILGATIGPFREPVRLVTKVRILDAKLYENERARKKLEMERDRLLATLKSLQADWAAGKETIRALREMVKNPDVEKRLVEVNQLAERLSQERAVLITKLNELQQKIQAGVGDPGTLGTRGAAPAGVGDPGTLGTRGADPAGSEAKKADAGAERSSPNNP